MQTIYYPDWKERIQYSNLKPQQEVLTNNDKVKVLIAGLEAGQAIPEHPEAFSVYHILEGSGQMTINGEQHALQPGVTLLLPENATRGVTAETRLAFLAVRIA